MLTLALTPSPTPTLTLTLTLHPHSHPNQAEFRRIDTEGGGTILFTDFCAWALEHALDLEEEDDWQPATGASTGSALAGGGAAPGAPAVLSGGSSAPERHAVGSAVSAHAVRELQLQPEEGGCSGGGEGSGGAASAGCSPPPGASAEADHAAFSAAVSEAVQLAARLSS